MKKLDDAAIEELQTALNNHAKLLRKASDTLVEMRYETERSANQLIKTHCCVCMGLLEGDNYGASQYTSLQVPTEPKMHDYCCELLHHMYKHRFTYDLYESSGFFGRRRLKRLAEEANREFQQAYLTFCLKMLVEPDVRITLKLTEVERLKFRINFQLAVDLAEKQL